MERLHETNRGLLKKHEAEQDIRKRLVASLMMVGRILIILSLYIFLLPLAEGLKSILPSDSIISFGFIILLTTMTWNYQRHSGLPKSVFGLGLSDRKTQICRGFVLSLPWLGFFLLLKFLWAGLNPATTHLFEPSRAMSPNDAGNWPLWSVFALVYVGMSFAQEYVRAVVQGALALFYQTTRRPDRWKSLLIANIVFAILHVHLSPIFAVIAFLAGLIWGWIFQRERSYLILGVPY